MMGNQVKFLTSKAVAPPQKAQRGREVTQLIGNMFVLLAAFFIMYNIYWFFQTIVLRCNTCAWDQNDAQMWIWSHQAWYQDPTKPPIHPDPIPTINWASVSVLDIIKTCGLSILFVIMMIIVILWEVILFLLFTLTVPLYTSGTIYALIGAAILGTKAVIDERDTTTRLRAVQEPQFNPLNRAGHESPLGEASFAKAADVSAALRGDPVEDIPPPRFED